MTARQWKLGALGGPQTFGAQAARLMLGCYPEFDRELAYYPTSDEALEALLRGEVTAFCAPEQMSKTGFHAGMQARMTAPGSPLHVLAEITHAYHCSLLGKPGADIARVRRVLGHTGSVTQSRPWLEANLPHAEIDIVDTSSFGAARSVLDGDGSIASVGTPELARECGLVELAQDIDGASVGSYWALSRDRLFSRTPTRLVVAGRMKDDGQLSRLICAMSDAGYALQTVSSRPSGKALYEYDYMLRLRGEGTLETVEAVLAGHGSMRLAGAFEARSSRT
ncbi:MAG: pheA [Noviherbaspirillum sp.]|nr:pheA [Noviherbaspirillum sp.]